MPFLKCIISLLPCEMDEELGCLDIVIQRQEVDAVNKISSILDG